MNSKKSVLFKEVNSQLRAGKLYETSIGLESLIFQRPFFPEYYINYVMATGCLADNTKELAIKNLDDKDLKRVFSLLTERENSFKKKYSGLIVSFCLSVKNRSIVNVTWNGVTRNKTYVTSYKEKHQNFQLNLLKNFVKSVASSQLEGVKYEIIISDYGSTDDHPKNWLPFLLSNCENVSYKIIECNGPFSRGEGLNIAADNSVGDVLFYIDADMLVSKELMIQTLDVVVGESKPFFPICYSYYTPFHKEGWLRTEGWGNLAVNRQTYKNIRWWEKKSWGSEDNHMKDQLSPNYIREFGLKFFHQWHPEDDFKTKHYQIKKNKYRIVIGVTTYNRIDYLKKFLESWNDTRNKYYNWTLIVNDDGSSDGTIEFLEKLDYEDVDFYLIKNNRVGVHEGTNAIFDRFNSVDFDYAFKCDDDVVFKKSGWDDLYLDGLSEFGYLCNYNTSWRQAKVISQTDKCQAFASAYFSQGAFFAFTKEVVNKLGWFDTKVFGYKGYGHIDFSVRACRAGFNRMESLFDVKNSSDFITLQFDNYKPALSLLEAEKSFGLIVDEKNKEIMKRIILEDRKEIIHCARSSIYENPHCVKIPSIHVIIHNNHIGGAEYVHFLHALALKNANCRVIVWSVGTGFYFDKYKQENIDIHFCPDLLDEKSNDWLKFSSSVNDGDYIYNCNAYNDEKFFELSKKTHIYYNTILHSDVDWIINHQARNKYFVHRFICIHEHIAARLIESGVSKSKVEIVYNSLTFDFPFGKEKSINLKLREELKIPSHFLVVGFVGRIAKDKNALDLLDIAETVLRNRDDVFFVIIGGVSNRKIDKDYYDEFLAKHTLMKDKDRIIFLGEKLGKDLIEHLNVIDVAINVSPSEGLPISLLEQLGKGIYCVYPSFPAISNLLAPVPSGLINIEQRKSNQKLNYSEHEKKMFVREITDLNKEKLQSFESNILEYAQKNYSFTELSNSLTKAFFGLNFIDGKEELNFNKL